MLTRARSSRAGSSAGGEIASHCQMEKLTRRQSLNFSGQLGQGSTTDIGSSSGSMGNALPFVKLGSNQVASMIATGDVHTCAILTNGVKCWG